MGEKEEEEGKEKEDKSIRTKTGKSRGRKKEIIPGTFAALRSKLKADVENKLSDYFDIDCEDIIADDIKCRFRYIPVQPVKAGLSLNDIVETPEKELNQIVGLKRLATYRQVNYLESPHWKRK